MHLSSFDSIVIFDKSGGRPSKTERVFCYISRGFGIHSSIHHDLVFFCATLCPCSILSPIYKKVLEGNPDAGTMKNISRSLLLILFP